MIAIKTYNKYIIKSFLKSILLISIIFLFLVFILNILEEVKFFENLNENFLYPFLLTLLNTPSILFEIFPFIFLIATQMFFINIFEKDELSVLKNNGLNNLKIINILIITSVLCGIFISTIFYTFSSNMKNTYLSFKNKFTNDNKYLAVINENGLWIKDEVADEINIINAELYEGGFLEKITITKLDKNFDLIESVVAKKANIENTTWVLSKVRILKKNGETENFEKKIILTNFDREKINSLFSNLSSFNIIQLLNLSEDYGSLGYSTTEIETYLNNLYAFPLYLTIMTVIGAILMLNTKYNKSKIFNAITGVLLSVSIYYINYFFNLLGTNERIPILLSAWLPQLMLIIICIIGLIKINEK